jgi:hypothetical protein
MQANRGLFPPTAPLCDAFAPRGAAVEKAHHEAEARVARAKPLKNIAPVIRSASGAVTVAPGPTAVPSADPNEQVELLGGTMTRAELMELFLEASGLTDVPLAQKWEGGVMRLVPHDPALQPKDIPIDGLFHKVVMLRDRLRTLEQKINAHPKLTDAEKVEMQSYVTKCYGSLTSFNLLFRDERDKFVGEKIG